VSTVDAAQPIQVFLIPTRNIDLYSHGIDLAKLAEYLNGSIRHSLHSCCLQFKVILDKSVDNTFGRQAEYKYLGLDLKQIQPFRHFELAASGTTTSNNLKVARETAIVDLDAFEQLQACARSEVRKHPASYAIIVGIGSGVISEDRADAEWTGIREEDAYSCLGDIMTYDVTDNDTDRTFRNVCYISLARAYSKTVFGPRLSEPHLKKPAQRAIIARYLIANIAHALSAILFRQPLPREHNALCVAETAWSGGELESYSATRLCESCRRMAQTGGLARYYVATLRDWETAYRCIESVTQVSTMIDKDVSFYDRYNRWVDFTIAAGLIGTFFALLVAYDSKDPLPAFLEAHWPASFVILAFLVSTIFTRIRFWLKSRAIP
jgi:hypothetical protein